MSLEKEYREALVASLSMMTRQSVTKLEVADVVIEAALNGSTTAYDAIIHHWVSFNDDGRTFPDLYHPAALVATVSDRHSTFANQNVFQSAFSDLMTDKNRDVIYIPNGVSYLDNLSEAFANTVPRTFFVNTSNMEVHQSADLQHCLEVGITRPTIDAIVFFWGWNFLNSVTQVSASRRFKQFFDPTDIGSGLRVLKQLPSTAEADASFYPLSRKLLGLPSRAIIDLPLTFTNEKFEEMRQKEELQERYFCKPLWILTICKNHLAAANFMIEDNFNYTCAARCGYPFSMHLEEAKDDRIILTTSGKHFLGFAIAVFTAIAQILDSSASERTLQPPIYIDNRGHGHFSDSDCIVDYFKEEKVATDRFINNLISTYPILATYRDYFLHNAKYMDQPRFAFKDDKIQI